MSDELNLVRISRSKTILTAQNYPGVMLDSFDPNCWGAQATAVSEGGRGSAWFLRRDAGPDWVLRHYRRGGLVGRIIARSYIFTGLKHTRALRELWLLQDLKSRGLPVPAPVAAYIIKPNVLVYQAAILIERIPDAVPWPGAENKSQSSLWHKIGRTIRQFHKEGLYHADLNCDNVMVAGEDIYLIDFDKCELRPVAPEEVADWMTSNLERLKRSVDKRLDAIPKSTRNELWRQLEEGYFSGPA